MVIDDTDIGKNIQYHKEGWRCGRLEEIKGKFAIIKPINRLASQEPHNVKVQIVEFMKDGQEIVCCKKIEETKNDEEASSKASEEGKASGKEEASPKVRKSKE